MPNIRHRGYAKLHLYIIPDAPSKSIIKKRSPTRDIKIGDVQETPFG
jgi:hypothetical protein